MSEIREAPPRSADEDAAGREALAEVKRLADKVRALEAEDVGVFAAAQIKAMQQTIDEQAVEIEMMRSILFSIGLLAAAVEGTE